jgi:hypothetical protein
MLPASAPRNRLPLNLALKFALGLLFGFIAYASASPSFYPKQKLLHHANLGIDGCKRDHCRIILWERYLERKSDDEANYQIPDVISAYLREGNVARFKTLFPRFASHYRGDRNFVRYLSEWIGILCLYDIAGGVAEAEGLFAELDRLQGPEKPSQADLDSVRETIRQAQRDVAAKKPRMRLPYLIPSRGGSF